MQTNFSLAQLADPDTAEAEKILRKCVHCGFCTATCPTYVLLGDELDSPRGRIYLMKDMLEAGKPASPTVVKHVDRCLSCLSCMTTCPSGVHYMHLVDHARAHIEATYRRPLAERALRGLLAVLLPRPWLFRLALMGAWFARPLRHLLPQSSGMPGRMRAMLAMAPARLKPPSRSDLPASHAPQSPRRLRVALLTGCAQPVLAPEINEATIRLLTRHGCEVVVAAGAGCCGALTHHMGKTDAAHAAAAANIRAWKAVEAEGGLDAVVINASGCGTTVKDYGFMFRNDPDLAADAARISALAMDVTEVMEKLGLAPPVSGPAGQGAGRTRSLAVAYHSACSMQHGQKLTKAPKALLAAAGFSVRDVPEGHLCCGSAGTYNLLQPEIAGQLQQRKVANIQSTGAAIVAAGNIGCITQIAAAASLPVLHSVLLLDWATGGPLPEALAGMDLTPEAAGHSAVLDAAE